MQRTTSILFAFLFAPLAFAHDLPSQLPEPQSVAEAWNVIEESAANTDKLLESALLADIQFQVANATVAMKYLSTHPAADKEPEKLRQFTDDLSATGVELILITRAPGQPLNEAKSKWTAYRKTLASLESRYPDETIHAAVYICPMHPHDRHLKPEAMCSVCNMSLVRRHLPASSVYEKPGEPTMKLSVSAAPLVVGQSAQVKLQLSNRDGSPVLLTDLIEMHTRKIHLLINDRSLGDYHHEHPTPTATPGEYSFSFIPRKPGQYRIWADVVPGATGVQEYVIADIPAATAPAPLTNRQTVSSVIIDGRKYELALLTDGKPVRVGQTIIGTITVTGSDGKPFVEPFEPIMGAYAHIVGFSEDQKTILHIHPYGRAPEHPEDRAGPAFAFKLYVPAPGFLRLYGQVQIGGASQFAPFGLTVLPAENPATMR